MNLLQKPHVLWGLIAGLAFFVHVFVVMTVPEPLLWLVGMILVIWTFSMFGRYWKLNQIERRQQRS